ncbi:Protein mesA [Smittium culicis]|uniref:Protein mesA n=1 Tax=Smittium culicis TaxID=133412 RepID=A0A1R1YFI5_9FUNG|nr:Protein mesA [Smittium culicis]
MLPDGAHTRENDWTIFMLNQDYSFYQPPSLYPATTHSKNQFYPISLHNLSSVRSIKTPGFSKSNDDVLEMSGNPCPGISYSVGNKDLLYCINLVRTKYDSGAKRGAVVKAMAICSRLPHFHIFKPVLLLALESYYRNPSIEALNELYTSINSMDTANIPQFNIFQKSILRHSTDHSMIESISSLSLQAQINAISSPTAANDNKNTNNVSEKSNNPFNINSYNPQTKFSSSNPTSNSWHSSEKYPNILSINDKAYNNGQPITFENYTSHGNDYRFFPTKIVFQDVNLSVRIPLTMYSEEIGDTSLAKLITKFGGPLNNVIRTGHPHLDIGNGLVHPISILINAVLTQKRIIFLGFNLPADEVASYVVAAIVIGSGGGNILHGLKHRAFPYACLPMIDKLLQVPGFIAGVTNPAFEDHPGWWDVLFNVKTGKVIISSNLISQKDSLVNHKHDDSSRYSIDGASSLGHKYLYKDLKVDKNFFYDQEFINDLYSAINNHMNEVTIREKFENYFRNFLVLVAIYEQQAYKSSQLFFAPKTPINSKINHDLLGDVLSSDQINFGYSDEIYLSSSQAGNKDQSIGSSMSSNSSSLPSSSVINSNGSSNGGETPSHYLIDNTKLQKEIKMNIGRIEGFIGTILYKNIKADIQQNQRQYPVVAIDVQTIINRLRNGTNIPQYEVIALYHLLNAHINTPAQIEMLLSFLPLSSTGLIPLVFGLYHMDDTVRFLAASLLAKIEKHPVGSKFVNCLNYFHKSINAIKWLETQDPMLQLPPPPLHLSPPRSLASIATKICPSFFVFLKLYNLNKNSILWSGNWSSL